MATLEQLHDGLRKADAAGNVDDARAFANAIRGMQSEPTQAPEKSYSVGGFLKSAGEDIGNLAAGAVRGSGSIGATILAPYDMAMDAYKGDRGKNLSSLITGKELPSRNQERRQQMDSGLQAMGANPDSYAYKGGKLAGEIAGTAGTGNVLALGAKGLGAAPQVVNALRSGGMVTGGSQTLGKELLTRAGAGAATGALSTAMVSPDAKDVGMGAAIGAVTPGVLQLAGKFGSSVYNAVKSGQQNAGKLLANAMGISEAELPAIIKAANNAPESLVPNSKLTLSQALQQQGANTPGAKMLERAVAGGRSGNPLLQRYEDQGAARMASLQNEGAQTYQGAAREESVNTGNKLSAILRTQSQDAQSANKNAWNTLYRNAENEGAALQIPLEDMRKATATLGRGSVVDSTDVNRVLKTAEEIGSVPAYTMPAVKPMRGSKTTGDNLEQFVRSQGGMRSDARLGGESKALSNRQSGTTGLINNKNGKTPQQLADAAWERGFIAEPDSGLLMEALQGRGGLKTFANDAPEILNRRAYEQAMGDAPEAAIINKPVSFAEFQRLRRDAGALAAKASSAPGASTEAGVLSNFKDVLTKRVDDVASGNLQHGESFSPELMREYNAARDATRQWHETYNGGNNIASIVKKPVGQDYRLTGDEVTNKLWHGGAGLDGDIRTLKNALGSDNFEPAMNALRGFIMTDAASKTTASGQFGAALPKYVESRMPGLKEALNENQLAALSNVAKDIRNAEAAAGVVGLRGSDTQAKIDRALSAGLLDSDSVKSLSKLLSIKGIGLETGRNKLADLVIQNKGDTLAKLLANPKLAAKALEDSAFTKTLDSKSLKLLQQAVLRGAPILATD
jgi:hypothetical protein